MIDLQEAARHLLAMRAATAAATANAATGSPAATGVARTGAAAVSPAAEVPEVAAEVEAAVLASQYNWLERTAGGVQPTLTLT